MKYHYNTHNSSTTKTKQVYVTLATTAADCVLSNHAIHTTYYFILSV